MYSAMKQDDVYAFVKAYCSRGAGLSRQFLEELANSRSLNEMASKLKPTGYGEQISALAGKLTSRKLESALRASLTIFNYKLLTYYRTSAVLERYFERNLSWNLKVALKGKALGLSFEDLSEMLVLGAEELAGRRDLIVRVLSAASLEQAVGLLENEEVYPYLLKALAVYKQTKEVNTFDLFLDRFAIGKLAALAGRRARRFRLHPRGVDRTVKDLVGMDVDGFNVLATLRAKWLDLPPSTIRDLLVAPSYKVNPDLLEAMARAENVIGAAEKLRRTAYRQVIPKASSPEEMIGGIEDSFLKSSLVISRRAFSARPMSEPVLLAALKVKEAEVRNLSSIAFGLETGVSASTIIGKLVFV